MFLQLYKLSKEQLIIYVRRDSRGKGAQAKYPGVKKISNDRYQAAYKPDLKAKPYVPEKYAIFNICHLQMHVYSF